MTIIFYEEQYAKDLIINGADKLSRRDLNYIAKYWASLGFSEKSIESNLIEYCNNVDPNFNEIQNYDFYHGATIHARNNKLRIPEPIRITKVNWMLFRKLLMWMVSVPIKFKSLFL